MTPAPTPPPIEAAPGPKQMSEGARLAGVFFSPGKAFADIALRPRWWIPVILSAILSTVYLNAFSSRVGWEQVIRQAMEQSPQVQNMPAPQREQLIRNAAGIYKYVGYAAPVLSLFYVFIISVGLLLLFDVMMGAEIGLKRLMGVVSYAFLPLMIFTALSIVVLFLKNPEDFDLQNPLMFNVGAFLNSDAPAWLKAIGRSVDLFSFWVIALLAIGLVAASRKKMSFGKALTGIAIPWMLFVAVITSLAALRG